MGACFCTHPLPFGILLLAASLVGGRELSKIHGAGVPGLLGSLLFGVGVWLSMYGDGPWPVISLVLWVLGCVTAVVALRPGLAQGAKASLSEVSTLYVSAPLFGMWLLHRSSSGISGPWDFKNLVILTLIPLWAGDSAAIFAGRAFGKHLLAPSISPKKTWEGAIANFLFCVLAAWGTGVLIGLPSWVSILCGTLSGTFGQAGDLYESWLKRRADVKDSGALLPGHGGLLDRIDSLLFTALPILSVIAIWQASR